MSNAESPIIAIAEAEIISERPLDGLSSGPQSLPSALVRAVRFSIAAGLLVFPLCFGGVHESVYLPVMTVCFVLTSLLCFSGQPALRETFSAHSLSRQILALLAFFALYCLLQGLFFSALSGHSSPLGASSRLPDLPAYIGAVLSIAMFIASFMLVRTLLQVVPRFHNELLMWIRAGGVIVALVALSHWFYDNGRLFWIFEPNNIQITERARWPFVNPNHLGHFLIPVFFLLLAQISAQLQKFRELYREDRARDRRTVSAIAQSTRLQRKIMKIAFSSSFTLAVLLCIFGTLSRGTWLGLAVGSLLYFAFSRHFAPKSVSNDASPGAQLPRRRSSGMGRSTLRSHRNGFSLEPIVSAMSKLGRPLLVVLSLCLVGFFLSERGRDLVAERIDYGLLYSRDDMRWQMYEDSLPLLKQHALLGVGLGGWDKEYQLLKTPLLSGLAPVYLHSDPYQLLIECGILGIAPILVLVALLFSRTRSRIRALSASNSEQATRMAALLSALLAFGTASLLDFPWRMPAILFLWSCLLALTSFYNDEIYVSRR